jgi:uncharacterized protein YsxB (DUF464 family)
MIEATFYVSPVPTEVEIKGHAFYADRKNDSLCAAVSAVLQHAIIAIENFSESLMDFRIEDGYGTIKVKNPDNAAIQELETLRIFLENLAKDYSQLKVEVRNNEFQKR